MRLLRGAGTIVGGGGGNCQEEGVNNQKDWDIPLKYRVLGGEG